MIVELIETFKRDLGKLYDEIAAYTDEADLWKTTEGISNSAGNLCLHLIGNLNHFIGTTLGNTGFVRQRDREFSDQNIPREVLLKNIELTSKMAVEVLSELNVEELEKMYPIRVFADKRAMKTSFFLIHLTGHLNYHLGQINYHRRMLPVS